MTTKVALFIFSLITFTVSCSSATNTTGSINWWCTQTPNYETCKHYLTANPTTVSANQFLDMTIQAAITEASAVLKRAQVIESKYPNIPGKSLWGSCVDYFDGIGFTLNEIFDKTLEPTPVDVQTWLSAGLTYITMCENGFELINMTNPMLTTITTNLQKLRLNSLSISVLVRGGNNHVPVIMDQDFNNFNDEDNPDVVVAQDGSGNFSTIQEAVNSANSMRRSKRFVIYVKGGVYQEYVVIPKDVKFITMYGDGINQTIITGDRYLGGDVIRSTKAGDLIQTSTFQVWGRGFIARDMTFRNTAGAELQQAIALLSSSDQSTVYHCSIEGYQDTLYTTSYSQFYRDCQIFGTVDFIFGNARAVFQDCGIYIRKPRPQGGLVVTAHGREFNTQNTGYSLQGCNITAAADLIPIIGQIDKAFLGRPWYPYARVVYMQSFIDNLIDPQGWLDTQTSYEASVYYGEYANYGPGSPTNGRVNWPGYHVIQDQNTANPFTVAELISGNDWLPETGVPFNSGF